MHKEIQTIKHCIQIKFLNNVSAVVPTPFQERLMVFQSRFQAFCLVYIEKIFSPALRFHSCAVTFLDYSLRLLWITGYQQSYLLI